ncbi:hypothetical protein AAFF_G00098020 [Aldrovandia affinis]|uniref:Uncharacterized protein n=1 Tax=Aldrovandia affinis TaxID=143900 RepID=A0AAD7VXV5_9TELE|nr:hypothetical protein AAFF_G00098020 [Aldrovandia affinis]
MRDVMKSIDTIRQEADKRMRAQQSRQSGQQCGPVELKKEVSFKAQRARRRGRRAGVAVRTRCRPSSMLHTFSMAAGHNVRLSCLRPILPASPSELPAFAR